MNLNIKIQINKLENINKKLIIGSNDEKTSIIIKI